MSPKRKNLRRNVRKQKRRVCRKKRIRKNIRGNKRRSRGVKKGFGFFNTLINRLPFELHMPGGYNFCGPGTNLKERLNRGDRGINPLDDACKQHDITYSQYPKDITKRHEADKLLEEKAWRRVNSNDASFGEKAAAWIVTNAIKAKRKLGMGCASRKKSSTTRRGVRNICNRRIIGSGLCFPTTFLNKKKPRKGGRFNRRKSRILGRGNRRRSLHPRRKTRITTFSSALHQARNAIRNTKSLDNAVKNALIALRKLPPGNRKSVPRVIPIPKLGGGIPIVPILAGLNAFGRIAGTVGTIIDTIKEIIDIKRKIFNGGGLLRKYPLTSITGGTLYIGPYRKGVGLYTARSKN